MNSGAFYDQVARCPGLGYVFQEPPEQDYFVAPQHLHKFVTCTGLDYLTVSKNKPVPLMLAMLSDAPPETKRQAASLYVEKRQETCRFPFETKHQIDTLIERF